MARETILMLGESNCGGFNSLTPPQTYANASRIFVCRGNPLSIMPASDPLVVGFNFSVGPGMACADEYIAQRNDPSLQICLMVGIGLHATDWLPGSPNYQTSIDAALYCEANWGPVVGVVFTQGVNDAIVGLSTPLTAVGGSVFAITWPVFMRETLGALRVQLAKPALPIVFNGLPPKPATADYNWDRVQTFIDHLPVDVTHLATVLASDLAVNDPVNDAYHFTAPSAVTLGRRDAQALVGL